MTDSKKLLISGATAQDGERLLSSESEGLYLSERSLSQRWGMSVKTLQKWRWNGDGPEYVKFGSAVRYPMEAITRFEVAAKYEHTSQY